MHKRDHDDDQVGLSFCVANVAEAVALVELWRDEGLFDLFRGQICNYPLIPSILRQPSSEGAAIGKLNRFAEWVHASPELHSLHSNHDAILAVAQHYGIPTPLLDFSFSPKVAGFFAANGVPSSKAGDELNSSCIICVNRKRLETAWAKINKTAMDREGVTPVRVIDIDVKNLWRLQAQQGVFIETHVPSSAFIGITGAVRILFPYTGPLNGISHQAIYPNKKSHLQILLDQFFNREFVSQKIEDLEHTFGPATYIQPPKMGYPQSWTNTQLPDGAHPSWKAARDFWLKEPEERLESTVSSRNVILQVPNSDLKQVISASHKIVLTLLETPLSRFQSLDWAVVDTRGRELLAYGGNSDDQGGSRKIRCADVVALIWDGMRRLPFSAEQIATAISNYVALVSTTDGYSSVKRLYGRILGVELSTGGARARAFASARELVNCLRKDVFEFVVPRHLKMIEEGRPNNKTTTPSICSAQYPASARSWL